MSPLPWLPGKEGSYQDKLLFLFYSCCSLLCLDALFCPLGYVDHAAAVFSGPDLDVVLGLFLQFLQDGFRFFLADCDLPGIGEVFLGGVPDLIVGDLLEVFGRRLLPPNSDAGLCS